MTGKISRGGKTQMCKPWNDARGCPEPCPKMQKHKCDILVAKAQVCEGDHKREQHTGPIYGYFRP